jgi:diacylglycerol O-acyltransferase / wax synthase
MAATQTSPRAATVAPLRRRLSSLDAGFLYGERPDQPLHIGGCLVYDGPITLDALTRLVASRLHLLPRYRQTIVFPPFGVAHPTWEDDPAFDLRNHLAEVTLPAPGDDHVLSEVGGALYFPMLDRTRPLWQLILVHGHRDGNSRLLWKVHHAMVDGVASVDLLLALHDRTADAAPAAPRTGWQPPPLPDGLTLFQDALRDRLGDLAALWAAEPGRRLAPAPAPVPPLPSEAGAPLPDLGQPAPPVPFNGPLSTRRQIAWVTFSLPEVRAVKGVLGGTVNDLVLTILAGGLGRYLQAHAQPVAGVALRAQCPVSMRRPDEQGTLGNIVTSLVVPLYVGISDAVARLAAERAVMDRLKREQWAEQLYQLSPLADFIPPAWQAIAGQQPVTNTLLNTVSTNVPGPQHPLYLAGRRLTAVYPLGICSANIGLFHFILSYDRSLTVGLLVDPTLLPDVWFYADCLRASYAELKAAARRLSEAAAA